MDYNIVRMHGQTIPEVLPCSAIKDLPLRTWLLRAVSLRDMQRFMQRLCNEKAPPKGRA
jgi:hypothetical protein